MSEHLNKLTERAHIYETAPTCPFCGGTMLPIQYMADSCGPWTSRAYMYAGTEDIPGNLKACNQCGIVKFYRDGETDGL